MLRACIHPSMLMALHGTKGHTYRPLNLGLWYGPPGGGCVLGGRLSPELRSRQLMLSVVDIYQGHSSYLKSLFFTLGSLREMYESVRGWGRQGQHWRRPKRTSRALPRWCPRTYNSRITHPATVDGVGYRPFLDVVVGGGGLLIAGFPSWGSSCSRCAAIADWSETPPFQPMKSVKLNLKLGHFSVAWDTAT